MTTSSSSPDAPGLFRPENGYDVLRLLLAATVIFAHAFPLGGFGEDPVDRFSQGQMLLGHIAVLGFFGLSGFLVAASCDRNPNPVKFLRKRFVRIVPGFWCCLLVCAFGFAPLIAAVRGQPYTVTGSQGALGYVLHNALLIINQPTIGSILAGQPHAGDLNSSLWSLGPEFLCYLCLSALGLAGGLARNRVLALVGVVLLLVFHVVRVSHPAIQAPLLPVLLVRPIFLPFFLSFGVGAALFAWRELFTPTIAATVVLALATLYLLRTGGFLLAGPVLIPLLVVFAGACFRVHLKNDFSYGLYIYSFPVQQLLTAACPRLPWLGYLALSLVGSFGFAVASWYLVERRFLRPRLAS